MDPQPPHGGTLTRGPNGSAQSHGNAVLRKPTTIHSLPYELLLVIFRAYARYEIWVRAAHVCREWRNLAHSTPSLWRNIRVLRNLDWLRHCLTLSNPLLVTVLFAHADGDLLEALIGMYNEGLCHRIEELDCRDLMNCSRIPDYLPLSPCVNLKCINIAFDHDRHGADRHNGHSPLLLLDSSQFPKLTDVDLFGVRMVTNNPNFYSQLTNLSLVGWEGDWSGRNVPSLEDMFNILKRCTSLERLVMTSMSRGLIHINTQDPQLAQSLLEAQGKGTLAKLPKLRRLNLTDNNRLIIPYLLSKMELAPDVNIALDADFNMALESEESYPTFTLTDYLLKLLPEPDHRRGLPMLQHINRIRFKSTDGDSLEFLGQREDQFGQLVQGVGAIEVKISRGMIDSVRGEMEDLGTLPSDIARLLTRETLAALLPTTNVRTLIFSANLWTSTLSTPARWTTILSNFPELRGLWVEHAELDPDSLLPLLDALRQQGIPVRYPRLSRGEPDSGSILPLLHALGQQGVQQDVPVPCPHLTSLFIGEVPAEDALFDALKTTLEWRGAQRTPPLKDLCLHLKAHPVKPLQPEALDAHHAALRSLVRNFATSSLDISAALYRSLDKI